MNELEVTHQAYDVVILASEARYWYFLLGSVIAGFAVISSFAKLNGESKDRALRGAGWVMIAANLVPPLYGRWT